MTVSHAAQISVSIDLGAVPLPQVAFDTVMLMRANTLAVSGDRTKMYFNNTFSTTTAADVVAGEIDATTAALITTAFAQRPQPGQVLLGNVAVIASAETYVAAYPLIVVDNPLFYGVSVDQRDDFPMMANLATVVESEGIRIMALQSADATWYDSGTPTAFVPLVGNERVGLCFHDVNGTFNDVGWLAGWLAKASKDVASPPATVDVNDVVEVTRELTSAERAFILANDCNLLGTFGPGLVMFEGVNMNGRPWDHIVVGDWFKARTEAGLQALMFTLFAGGNKLPVSPTGASMVEGVIGGILEAGVSAGHFVEGQTSVIVEAITQADIDARRLRVTVTAQLTTSATTLVISAYLSNSPIVS